MPFKFQARLAELFKVKPISFPSSKAQDTFKFEELDFNKKEDKKKLYAIYRRHPVIRHAVNLRAVLAIPSINIKCKSPKAKKAVSIFLKHLHPVSGELELVRRCRKLCTDTDIFGTGFWELLKDEKLKEFVGIKSIHPLDMDLIREQGEGTKVKRDKLDNPLGWEQIVNFNQKKQLPFRQVSYLTFDTVGDEVLGISTLESIYKTVYRLMNTEEGIATAIFRHGFPLYDVTVGTDQQPPTKKQIDSAAKEVSGLNFKSEFVHPPNYKIKLHEAYSLGKGHDYTGVFIDLIAAGFGLPRFMVMGSARELTRASAEPLLKVVKPTIKIIQDEVKLFLELHLLKPLMEMNHIDEIPEVEIGDWPILKEEIEKATSETKPEIEPEQKEQEPYPTSPASEPEDDEESEPENHEKGKRTLEHLKAETKLPGLYLAPPHANLIHEGDKKSIVKSKHEAKLLSQYIDKNIYLLQGDKVYGIIKLRKPREISINDFIQLNYAHKISEEERLEWWPDEKTLNIFEFDIISLFHPLKKYLPKKGVQGIIQKNIIPIK